MPQLKTERGIWKPVVLPDRKETTEFIRIHRGKTRFLVDENLGADVARVLCSHGWNSAFVEEVGLKGHDDEDVFAYCWKHDRMILTHDDDFLNDRRYPPHRNPGVIVLPGGSGEIDALCKALLGVVELIAPYRNAHRNVKIRITKEGQWTIWRSEPYGKSTRRLRIQEDWSAYEWETK